MCATYVCTSPIWQLTDSEYAWCLQAFKQSEKELPPNAIYVQAQGRALGGLTEVGPSTPRSEGTGPSNGLKRASPNLNVQVASTLNYGVRHERPMERVRPESRRRALRSGVWGRRRTPETGPRLVSARPRAPPAGLRPTHTGLQSPGTGPGRAGPRGRPLRLSTRDRLWATQGKAHSRFCGGQ